MTESEWLESADPALMLNCRCGASDRKLWLFICAVQRAWWGSEASAQDTVSIVTLERMADAGAVSRRSLDHVHFTYTVPANAHDAALECVRIHNSKGDHQRWADILRDIIGNPFRPVDAFWWHPRPGEELMIELEPSTRLRRRMPGDRLAATVLEIRPDGLVRVQGSGGGTPGVWEIESECNEPWLTSTALSLAHAAYHERLPDGTLDPLRLFILADALEESGCDGREILTHLRSPGPHWRGCWVVDLLLGKE